MFSAEVATRMLQLGISIILARILGPSVFGVYGVCLIFYRLVGAVGDLGFGTVIIQKEIVKGKVIVSVAALSLLFSCSLGVGLYIFANSATLYFSYDGLAALLRALSFIVALEGLCIILRSIYIRELRYQALSTIQLLAIVAGGVISLFLAFQGMGVWSLIFGLFAEIGLQVTLFIVFIRHDYMMQVDSSFIRENYNSALKILLARLIYYLNINMGALLIGKFLGVYALGLYVVAYGLVDTPVQRISKSVGMVSFAALSKFQNDIVEYEKTYESIKYYYSLIVFAVFMGLFIISEEFIAIFYGAGWKGMVTPLRVLCFVGIFRSLLVISSAALLALNKTGVELAIAFTQSIIMMILLIILIKYEITGACLALAFAHGLGYFVSLHYIRHEIKIKNKIIFNHLYNAFVPSVAMVFVWFLSKLVLDGRITEFSMLIFNTFVCGSCFILIVIMMDKSFFGKLRKFVFASG